MPRYTINTGAGVASVSSEAGRVTLNGASLLPHEADMLAEALRECAERAEALGTVAAQVVRLEVAAQRASLGL
jgi:hypothetical protein